MCEFEQCSHISQPDESLMSRRGFGKLAAGTVLAATAILNPSNPLEAWADASSCGLENPPLGTTPSRVEADSAYSGDNLPRVEVAKDLTIIPRSAWAEGLEPKGALEAEDVKFLLVHHSATTNDYEIAHVPQILRGVYNFHTGSEKGWADVCYNFFIDQAGNIYEGRKGSLDGPVMADATGGNQGFAQLVCLLGDFTDALPSCEMENSLVKILAWNSDRFNLDTTPGAEVSFVSRGANGAQTATGKTVTTPTIAPHNKMSATACPGNTLTPLVSDGTLQAWVNNYRQVLAAPSGSVGAATSEVITTPTTIPSSTTTLQPQVTTLTPNEATSIEQSPRNKSSETGQLILGGSLFVGGVAGVSIALKRYFNGAPQEPEY